MIKDEKDSLKGHLRAKKEDKGKEGYNHKSTAKNKANRKVSQPE